MVDLVLASFVLYQQKAYTSEENKSLTFLGETMPNFSTCNLQLVRTAHNNTGIKYLVQREVKCQYPESLTVYLKTAFLFTRE